MDCSFSSFFSSLVFFGTLFFSFLPFSSSKSNDFLAFLSRFLRLGSSSPELHQVSIKESKQQLQRGAHLSGVAANFLRALSSIGLRPGESCWRSSPGLCLLFLPGLALGSMFLQLVSKSVISYLHTSQAPATATPHNQVSCKKITNSFAHHDARASTHWQVIILKYLVHDTSSSPPHHQHNHLAAWHHSLTLCSHTSSFHDNSE